MALAPCVLSFSQPAAEHASAVNVQRSQRSSGSCSSPQSPKHPSTEQPPRRAPSRSPRVVSGHPSSCSVQTLSTEQDLQESYHRPAGISSARVPGTEQRAQLPNNRSSQPSRLPARYLSLRRIQAALRPLAAGERYNPWSRALQLRRPARYSSYDRGSCSHRHSSSPSSPVEARLAQAQTGKRHHSN
ncbi:hypothetical protein Taro_009592 [Colocasia esculenta]|uniref:Uncharacterized protein n=1 Tax=Colocasia esculenta TaxID=4460 RepID=A0A843TWQ6_COLES|nr:hypothetical protein [Colocasia esculenta]